MNIEDYKEISVEKVVSQLQTDLNTGLKEQEAQDRFTRYGYNEITKKEEPLWHKILRRFWGPIPWMIETAAILSAFVGRWEDFIIIAVMLIVNGGLDFYQEHKALNAIETLKKSLSRRSIVLRDGVWKSIDSKNLTVGDIIKIKIGDIVPADVKLAGGGDFLLIDQSALTGESLPVQKKSGDLAYSNSVVKQGEMVAVVVSTGENTYFGKTVNLVAKAEKEQKSHFQKMVINVGNYLIIITIVMIAVIIFVGTKRHEPIFELLEFSLVLTVSAIPVALPTVLTVVMAVGAVKLAKKQAIVSRLSAIEEMAGMDILCSDKTGTLTQNRMSVGTPFVFSKHTTKELFVNALFASRKENDDPLEKPLFEYAEKQKIILPEYELEEFIPFNPSIKKTQAKLKIDSKTYTAAKGAPQVIVEMCSLDEDEKESVYERVDMFAQDGFRTIGVAKKEDGEEKFEFLGLIPLYDPPRTDSKEAVLEAKKKGVEVKMATGDNIAVARYIAKILSIGENIYSIKELKNESYEEYAILSEVISKALLNVMGMDSKKAELKAKQVSKEVEKQIGLFLQKGAVKRHESEIIKIIEEANGFAEVLPEDKYFIVDKLQKADHIVGMTGDGVNDAPALKKADTGIAVSGATDAAKAAADIVLTSPGLKVIIDAIKEARITFERMKSYTIFRIAETIRIVIFMTLAIAVFNFYPLTSIMIIVLALLNDIPILAIAYDNTKIRKNPVRWDMHEMLVLSSWLGVAGVLSSFTIFYIVMIYLHSHAEATTFLPHIPDWVNINNKKEWISFVQSVFFAKMVIAGHGTIYNTRIDDWFFKKPYPSLLLFLATFSTRIIGTIIAVYGFGLMMPIGIKWALFMWIYALLWFVFNDMAKITVLRYYRKIKGVEVI